MKRGRYDQRRKRLVSDREVWWPEYRTADGSPFTVEEVEVDECPRSLVTEESLALVDLFEQGDRLKAATGAMLFGPDASTWPAIWADAVVTMHQQKRLYEIALMEAQAADARARQKTHGN